MNSSLGQRERDEARQRRRAPGQVTYLVGTFASGGKIPDPDCKVDGPVQLALETTNHDGALATWFDDDWFTTLLRRFGDQFLTLRIAPTPGALLHPTVLHEAEMTRRVVPHWRVLGVGYVDDLQSNEEIRTVANGPYHEVQFFDHARALGPTRSQFATHLSLEKLFVQLRRAQDASTGRSPILVRLPARAPQSDERGDPDLLDRPRAHGAEAGSAS